MDKDITSEKYKKLFKIISDLYHQKENQDKLVFHGWHHIKFVHDKAIEFAAELNANLEITASAALLHDLNYIYTDKLAPETANTQIRQHLAHAGFVDDGIERIIGIIKISHLAHRNNIFSKKVSAESKALSDADNLFKVLPTTPLLFTSKFIAETNYDIRKLARKIINEQEHLILSGQYFYTNMAKDSYSEWANISLQLWKSVLKALEDKSVNSMLQIAREMKVL